MKTGTLSGTMLAVELYENSLCSGVPLASESVAIGDFGITELLKQFKAKGATTTPAKVTRLNLTMENITPTAGADLFLKISGAGIVSVGGDCQAQAAAGPAGPAGTDGVDGAPGASGTTGCSTVATACLSATVCTSPCAAGQQVVGGGCIISNQFTPGNTLLRTYPFEDSPNPDSWICRASLADNMSAYAVCCP